MKMKRKQKRKNWIDKVGIPESPVSMIVISVLVLIMSCVFIFQYRDYIPISREEAHTYSGEFDHYEIAELGRRGRTEYLDIYLNDGTVLRLHHRCSYTDVRNALDLLDKSDELTILVNPASEYVIEILSEDAEILNIDDAQKRMQNEAIAFVVLGAVLLILAIFTISVSVYRILRDKQNKSQKGKQKSERSKR